MNTRSEPKPDFVLLGPWADFYQARHPVPADVFLLVEVANGSVLYDREDKRRAYAKAGIGEYWLINLPECVVEIYREPASSGYAWTASAHPGERLAPAAFPDAELAAGDLLSGGTVG